MLISGLLGFASQKILVSVLTVKEFAKYDLLLSIIGIFISTLGNSFINYYLNRTSQRNISTTNLPPVFFLIAGTNLVISLFGLIIISFWYPLNVLNIGILLLFQFSFLLFEFKKVLFNINQQSKKYSIVNILPSFFLSVFLIVTHSSLVTLNSNIVLILFALAYLIPFIVRNPALYKLSMNRLKTLVLSSKKFILPLIFLSLIAWGNENLGKFFLLGNNVSLEKIGLYVAAYGLVMRIVFTSSSGLDFFLVEKLFGKAKSLLSFKLFILTFSGFAFLIVGSFYFFSETIITIFLSEKYLSIIELCFPFSITALCMKSIHLVERYFVKTGNTRYSLFVYISVTILYICFLLSKKDVGLDWVCYSHLYSVFIGLILSLILFFQVRRKDI